MNNQEFVQSFSDSLDEMKAIMIRKNADYAGSAEGSDPFKNFRLVEALGIASVETWFLVRMSDKVSRLTTLIMSGKDPKVTDESISDTLSDLANYSILLKTFIKSKNSTEKR